MADREIAALAALSSIYANRALCAELLRRFGTLEEAWASAASPDPDRPLPPRLAPRMTSALLEDAAKDLDEAESEGIIAIPFWDPRYPSLLSAIVNPPPLLWCKGDLSVMSIPSVAMVGSRSMSMYGQRVSRGMSSALVDAGFCVVSGLALGIDAECHRAALDRCGKTVAVLGSGLKAVYPAQNQQLADDIAASGCVVSEFPIHSRPQKFHFPRRNRVISGLSIATVVVEAGLRSGALITATWAAEQGREVFAVPGPVDTGSSAGCHQLLREGARIAETVADIESEIATLKSLVSKKPPEGLDTPSLPFPEPAPRPPAAPMPVREPLRVSRRPVETPAASEATREPAPVQKPSPQPAQPVPVAEPQPALPLSSAKEARRKIILDAIGSKGATLDDIEMSTGLGPEVTLPILMELELEGKVSRKPGNMFLAARPKSR